MTFSLKKFKRAKIVFLVAFVVVTLVLVSAWILVPKIRSYTVYTDHEPIHIDGDQGFVQANGVARGSGSESDPYVIEGWSLSCKDAHGVLLRNTMAHVVIRNITITSSGYSFVYDGVHLRNASNVIVENLIITYANHGVLVDGIGTHSPSSISVFNCSIVQSKTSIYFGNMTQGVIANNFLLGSSQSCIVVEHSTNAVLKENIMERVNYEYYSSFNYNGSIPDVLVQDSDDVLMFGNQFDSPYYQSRSAEITGCQDVAISGNRFSYTGDISAAISGTSGVSFTNNSCAGVSFDSCSGCDIYDNNCWGSRTIQTSSSSHMRLVRNIARLSGGINLQSTSDSLVKDNIIKNGTRGITATGSNNLITGNLIADSSGGLYLRGNNITAVHNIISNSAEVLIGGRRLGIEANSVTGLVATDNSISVAPNQESVYLMNCHDSAIMNCSMNGSLEFDDSHNLTLVNNSFSGNGTIELDDWTDTIDIRHNALYNISVINYFAAPALSWDGGYPDGGNFWSQYAGVDEKSGVNQNLPGADGIGDTPFVISPNDTDLYPLMSPIVPDDRTPPKTVLTLNALQKDSEWYASQVNFTLDAFDNQPGVSRTMYRIDRGPWSNYTSQILMSSEGEHLLEYYSIDDAGNEETTFVTTVKIDTENPQLAQGTLTEYRFKNTKIATIHIEYEDNSSGVLGHESRWAYSYRGSPLLPETIQQVQIGLSDGEYTYLVAAQDKAGNWAVTNISIVVSLNENRDPLSLGGPYGPWYEVGVFSDMVLLGIVLWLTSVIVWGPIPPRREGETPGEIDKEVIIDGYPKYMRKL